MKTTRKAKILKFTATKFWKLFEEQTYGAAAQRLLLLSALQC